MMEKAFSAEGLWDLKKIPQGTSRLYFGPETCENKIPSPKEASNAKSLCEENNLEFTLMSPFCTGKGLGMLKDIFSTLSEKDEIVANDFGLLLEAADSKAKPVAGRLLNKQFRDPRIKEMGLGKELLEHLSTSQASVKGFRELLGKYGVKRFELDNLSHGIGTNLSGTGFSASVYYPLVFVSATRFCLAANCSSLLSSKKPGIFSCSKECLGFRFKLVNQDVGKIFMLGNSLYFENTFLPSEKALSAKGIDRIVTNKALLG